MKKLLTLLSLLLISCDPAGTELKEERADFEIEGLGHVRRFVVASGRGVPHYIYVVDGNPTASVNHQQGKQQVTTIIVNGIEYEARPK